MAANKRWRSDQSEPNLEALYSSDELARLLGVSARTLDHWAYVGDGPPFIKVVRQRRYQPSDVRAWLAANRQTSTRD
jgi:DNA-binding transcriptional MerR regulator